MLASVRNRCVTTALLLAGIAGAIFASALAPAASAKVLVERARACGIDECHTTMPERSLGLPFELLRPAVERDRRSQAPDRASAEPRYRITLHARPGDDVVRVEYLPGPDYIRVRGLVPLARGRGVLAPPGARRGRAVARGWVKLEPGVAYAYARSPSEIEPYAELVAGIEPFPEKGSPAVRAESDPGSAAPWLAAIGVGSAIVLYVLFSGSARRGRHAEVP